MQLLASSWQVQYFLQSNEAHATSIVSQERTANLAYVLRIIMTIVSGLAACCWWIIRPLVIWVQLLCFASFWFQPRSVCLSRAGPLRFATLREGIESAICSVQGWVLNLGQSSQVSQSTATPSTVTDHSNRNQHVFVQFAMLH